MRIAGRRIARLQILGILLASLNLTIYFSVPAIRHFVDQTTGRWADANNPRIMIGVQELLVYFDPWLASYVLPVIYTVGFAFIPFLTEPSDTQPFPGLGKLVAVVVSLLLGVLEMVWLALVAVEIFLRGPNWNLFWPGEKWDANRVVLLNLVNLSDYFWLKWSSQAPQNDMAWTLREMPGLVFVGCYLFGGTLLAYWLFRKGRGLTPFWCWLCLVLLFQSAAMVPIKVFLHWVFNLKYLIYLPEYHFNL